MTSAPYQSKLHLLVGGEQTSSNSKQHCLRKPVIAADVRSLDASSTSKIWSFSSGYCSLRRFLSLNSIVFSSLYIGTIMVTIGKFLLSIFRFQLLVDAFPDSQQLRERCGPYSGSSDVMTLRLRPVRHHAPPLRVAFEQVLPWKSRSFTSPVSEKYMRIWRKQQYHSSESYHTLQ
jgi:hypothetical protein